MLSKIAEETKLLLKRSRRTLLLSLILISFLQSIDTCKLCDHRTGKRTKLRDFNTGDAFRETYRVLIDPTKGEHLLGLPVYIDGAHISNFHDMELIQVKIDLGLMNRVTRMMEWVRAIL